jgi:transposase
MQMASDDLPDDVDALKALLRRERETSEAALAKSEATRRLLEETLVSAEAELKSSEAARKSSDDQIADLKLRIEKLRRALYGQSSERSARLTQELDQLELTLEDIEGDEAEALEAADAVIARAANVSAHTRRTPKRGPLPAHLPRERVVIEAPYVCPCCGSDKLSKLGEDVTETLEVIPRKFFVKQTVRERFSCRACETFLQVPAPFHVIARGRAGPSLLAMILWSKYAMHLPLNRQSDAFHKEGIPLEVSTMADWVGACAAALEPLNDLIRAHVFAAARLHGDDTTVPVLAKGKTRTGRLWAYVRDDKPFGGPDPPAVAYFYSADRTGQHPRSHLEKWSGTLQADAYAGFNALYKEPRLPGPILEAACWAHARRNFFELADIARAARDNKVVISPIALEAVKRIDAIFDLERAINGKNEAERLSARQETIRPLINNLHTWMTEQRARISGKSELGKAFDYMLKRWASFARFLDDGKICLTNNAAERMIRPLTLGRRNWTFAGSDRGAERAAAIYTLLQTTKLNDVDPQAWLADVLSRIASHPAARLSELLPWNWKQDQIAPAD